MVAQIFPHPAGGPPSLEQAGGGPVAEATNVRPGPTDYEIAGSHPAGERDDTTPANNRAVVSHPCGAPLPRCVELDGGVSFIRSAVLFSNRTLLTERQWRQGILDVLHAETPSAGERQGHRGGGSSAVSEAGALSFHGGTYDR